MAEFISFGQVVQAQKKTKTTTAEVPSPDVCKDHCNSDYISNVNSLVEAAGVTVAGRKMTWDQAYAYAGTPSTGWRTETDIDALKARTYDSLYSANIAQLNACVAGCNAPKLKMGQVNCINKCKKERKGVGQANCISSCKAGKWPFETGTYYSQEEYEKMRDESSKKKELAKRLATVASAKITTFNIAANILNKCGEQTGRKLNIVGLKTFFGLVMPGILLSNDPCKKAEEDTAAAEAEAKASQDAADAAAETQAEAEAAAAQVQAEVEAESKFPWVAVGIVAVGAVAAIILLK